MSQLKPQNITEFKSIGNHLLILTNVSYVVTYIKVLYLYSKNAGLKKKNLGYLATQRWLILDRTHAGLF